MPVTNCRGERLPYTGPAHRTAHTTTTTSIHMVPKTAATGARQHHPPAIATGGEFTSLPVCQSNEPKPSVSYFFSLPKSVPHQTEGVSK